MTSRADSRCWRARCAVVYAALAVAGCAVAPSPVPDATTPPIARPTTRPVSPIAPPPRDVQARYERVAFDALPTASDSDWIAAWPAWLNSCSVLAIRTLWKDVCARASSVDGRSASGVRSYFVRHFDAYRVRSTSSDADDDARDVGLVTGYYEPLLHGSRRESSRYRVPLYRVPDDLVVVDLASLYPELSGLRLRGRLQGRRLVPYASRGEITSSTALRGKELLWIDDAIEAFFLHVQGSGRVELNDGTTVRVGFGEHNGHPYRSIGRWLVDQGELTIDQASMQGIKAWAALHPQRLNELLAQNPSFVFFRELPLGDPAAGPKGALAVPLTAGASLAVDPRFVPLGAPVLLASTDPANATALVRPMVAQDTGGAIRGPLRFDIYWGSGADAGNKAGRQRHDGSAWLFTPKDVTPEALLQR